LRPFQKHVQPRNELTINLASVVVYFSRLPMIRGQSAGLGASGWVQITCALADTSPDGDGGEHSPRPSSHQVTDLDRRSWIDLQAAELQRSARHSERARCQPIQLLTLPHGWLNFVSKNAINLPSSISALSSRRGASTGSSSRNLRLSWARSSIV
jgi:hypothetical protein